MRSSSKPSTPSRTDFLSLLPAFPTTYGETPDERDQRILEERARETQRARQREGEAAKRRLLDRLGPTFPEEGAEALERGTLDETKATRAVGRWLLGRKPFLFLIGGTGVGKTMAAAWAAMRASDAQIVRATTLHVAYERWSSDRDRDVEPLRLNTELLVLDDLGLEVLEDRRTHAALEEIANARQGMSRGVRLRTIYTTNLDDEALRARYAHADRLMSRWRGGGVFEVIVDADRRLTPRRPR